VVISETEEEEIGKGEEMKEVGKKKKPRKEEILLKIIHTNP
jgi:hypothetical protein